MPFHCLFKIIDFSVLEWKSNSSLPSVVEAYRHWNNCCFMFRGCETITLTTVFLPLSFYLTFFSPFLGNFFFSSAHSMLLVVNISVWFPFRYSVHSIYPSDNPGSYLTSIQLLHIHHCFCFELVPLYFSNNFSFIQISSPLYPWISFLLSIWSGLPLSHPCTSLNVCAWVSACPARWSCLPFTRPLGQSILEAAAQSIRLQPAPFSHSAPFTAAARSTW